MNRDPLPLTVRSAPDLAAQRHAHRLTALAKSLIESRTVQPLRAPLLAPHAAPRPQVAGSADAARLEALKAELETRHWKLSRARTVGSVADIVKADAAITLLEERLGAVARALAEVDTRRSGPAGIIHRYAVIVPALTLTGSDTATPPEERWELDTHTLNSDLRARLTLYLLSGADALPFWYRRERGRYRPNPNAPPDYLALMEALWGHARRLPGRASPAPLVSVGAPPL